MSKKVVIVHPGIYNSGKDSILLDSFASDVVAIRYNDTMTKEELFAQIPIPEQITHLAFLYHYPGYDRLPFFYDELGQLDLSVKPEELVKSTYRYYSDTVIDIIRALKDGREFGTTGRRQS